MFLKSLAIFALLFLQESIKAQTNHIIVETSNTCLVLNIGPDKRVTQSYFGRKLDSSAYEQLKGGREVYLTAGMENQFEPAIRLIHADGNPSLELQYAFCSTKKQDMDVTTTTIILKDPVYPVSVTLHYTSYFSEDVIEEWTEITHHEKKAVELTAYASSLLHFDADSYWLTHFHGDWAREMQMTEEKLTTGIKSVESKLGTRTNFYQTQAFFLSLNKPSNETEGAVIAGTLAWTGNYKYSFEIDQRNGLRVLCGINSFASEYFLQPGEVFQTPRFIFTFSDRGKGQASRNLHRWARNYGVLNGNAARMILLNNWEATGMKFNENRLVELFDGAKKLGVDLFLLDDGWFGNKYPRNSDKAGLGDWQANKQKLPNGIGYLVQEAEKQNVHFGIWVEPEMVNPKSSLYEQHPDWIIRLPNRPEDFQRNQLVLDLCNPKVQDFVYGVLYDLLSKNPGIAYIKWDCNRYISNGYSMYLGKNQQALYVDYVRGLYSVLERIRKEYPTLEMMLCSGGGGRAEYGALKYFQEFWPSDNTDALSRIFIQWGYSYFFPAATLCNHVTSAGKQSLKFKLDVAMTGKLGFDIQVNNLSSGDLRFCRNAVENYKRLQNTINFGSLYRLVSPYQYNSSALMYADSSSQHAVLFAYNLHTVRWDNFSKIMLQGLDASKKYKVEEINLEEGKAPAFRQSGQLFTGDYLMKEGLDWYLRSPLSSSILEITAVE